MFGIVLNTHCTKSEVIHKDFFSKCDQMRTMKHTETICFSVFDHADLVTFTEEILKGKLHFNSHSKMAQISNASKTFSGAARVLYNIF